MYAYNSTFSHDIPSLFAMSACLAAESDKPKISMPGSCNAHARNLSTAKRQIDNEIMTRSFQPSDFLSCGGLLRRRLVSFYKEPRDLQIKWLSC